MKTDARFYIGFTTLEELLRNFSGDTIYISATTKTRTGTYGIKMTSWLVNVAEIKDEKCHYWQRQTGYSQSIGGNPMGDQEQKSRERTDDFFTQLKAELESRFPKVNIIEAIISFPSDLEVLQGQTEIFIYDKESDLFKKAEAARTAETI